ncbi:MAG: DUF2971 domain-containing protein [bacterium]
MFLFKYRPFDAFTESIIRDKALFFASPKQLNDPFDCHIIPEVDCTMDEWRAFCESSVDKFYTGPAQGRQIHLDLLIEKWKKNPAEIRDILLYSARDAMGVCCFSRTATNLLMWAHYADSHRGVCLVFRLGQVAYSNDPLVTIEPVRYEEEYPRINIAHAGIESTLDTMLLTKSKVWAYEQEWRAFYPGASTLHPLKTYHLWGVIMGLGISNEQKENLIEIAKRERMGLSIATRNPNAFGISAEVIRLPEY